MPFRCHGQRLYKATALGTEYLKIASESVPQFGSQLFGKLLIKCALPSTIDVAINFISNQLIDKSVVKYKCVVSVFGDVSNNTAFHSIWTKYDEKLNQTIHNCASCRKEIGVPKAKYTHFGVFSKIYHQLWRNMVLCCCVYNFRCFLGGSLDFLDLSMGFYHELANVSVFCVDRFITICWICIQNPNIF